MMEKVKHEHVIGDVTVTVELPAGMPEPGTVSLRWKSQDADDFARLAGMVGGLDALMLPMTRQSYEQSAHVQVGPLSVSIEEPVRQDGPKQPQRHPFFGPFADRKAEAANG
jgi:hypothetical protein